MAYQLTKRVALMLMKAPQHPPALPAGSHDSVQVFRASPRYLAYRLLWFALLFALLWSVELVAIVVATQVAEPEPAVFASLFGPVLALATFVTYVVVRIDYDMRYYIVTDRSIRVREGAVVVKEMTITHANVQNVGVVQGPILRLFGIWHLQVQTAGGGGGGKKEEGHDDLHAVRMAGIENAHEVRDLILEYLRKCGGGTGLGDLDDTAKPGGTLAASPALLAELGAVRAAAGALRAAAHG